jgi:hypothetical protein
VSSPISPPPKPLVERIREELTVLQADYLSVLERSELWCLETAELGTLLQVPCEDDACDHFLEWAPETPEQVVVRMLLDRRITELGIQHHAIYPVDMTEVIGFLGGYQRLRGLITRRTGLMSGGRGLPQEVTNRAFSDLARSLDYLPSEEVATRLLVDTTSLLDDPDLARYRGAVGKSYTVHLVPEVLHEVDRLKDHGNVKQKTAARRVDSRLKGYWDSADIRSGATVDGNVRVVFDFREPRREGLPSWLDLSVPDDRILASALELQYRHPKSAVVVGTRDLAMLGKLAGAGIPHFRTDITKNAAE